MTSQIKKTALRLLLGAAFLSFVVAACNNKKDKKEEPKGGDTTTVTAPPAPMPANDTMPKGDSLDDKPVKPGE